LFDEPTPDADAVLRNVVTINTDELPEPLPLAVLGAICNPIETSEP
jgi:hypothetical protein